jgi:hypothetical protein
MKRAILAVIHPFIAFIVVPPVACAGLMYTVRNSNDGQAGMGAAFGGFYVGVLAALIAFGVSLRRSSPSYIAKREKHEMPDSPAL